MRIARSRAAIQLLFYSAVIGARGGVWTPVRAELVPAALRSILGGASITLSYYALKLIPLGDATTIRFSLPIWTLIMGYFCLGESCSALKVCAVAISVAGVVLIAKPDECVYLAHVLLRSLSLESADEFLLHERHHERARLDDLGPLQPELGPAGSNSSGPLGQAPAPLPLPLPLSPATLRQFEGCMMALASSVCLAMSLIALRLCKRTAAEVIIFWLSLFSILIGSLTLLLLNEWRLPNNLPDLAYILLNGLCGSIGQWFITSALKVEQSGVVSLARTFDIEIAFLYSALLLDEQIRPTR